jgi:hypothetical protein
MEHGDANTSMVVLKKLLFYNLLLVTEGLGQAQICGEAKLINGIPTLPLCYVHSIKLTK